jgi:hypothetical protein
VMPKIQKKEEVRYDLLDLTQEEINTLFLILLRVGGSSDSNRIYATNIYELLRSFQTVGCNTDIYFEDTCSLYFREGKKL